MKGKTSYDPKEKEESSSVTSISSASEPEGELHLDYMPQALQLDQYEDNTRWEDTKKKMTKKEIDKARKKADKKR